MYKRTPPISHGRIHVLSRTTRKKKNAQREGKKGTCSRSRGISIMGRNDKITSSSWKWNSFEKLRLSFHPPERYILHHYVYKNRNTEFNALNAKIIISLVVPKRIVLILLIGIFNSIKCNCATYVREARCFPFFSNILFEHLCKSCLSEFFSKSFPSEGLLCII